MCGGGASKGEVQDVVDTAVTPLVEAGTGIQNTLGTASESGTVTSGTGTMTLPTTSVNPETGEVTTGTKSVDYGGNEVDVTDTIKGDTETLIGGQDKLGSQIDAGFANFQPVNVTSTTIDTSDLAKSDAMAKGFSDVLTDTGTIRLDIAGQGKNIDAIKEDTGKIGGIATDLGTVKTGVADANTALGGLATDISDLSGTQAKGFKDLTGTVNKGFTDAGTAMTTGFADAQTDRDKLSADVLGGQGKLQQYLNDMSGRADTYYQGLSGNQATLMEDVGGLQSNFTDFRDTYDANTKLANQTRAELQDSVVGGFNRMRGDMGQGFADTTSEVRGVGDSVARGTSTVTDAQNAAATDYTQAIKSLATGMDAATSDEAAQQGDIMQRLDTVRNILSQQDINISDGLREQYTKLATSFDAQGKLIRESVDDNGNVTRRAMDEQSNILMAEFNSQGGLLNQSVINVNTLLKQMDELGYTNANVRGATGDQSPQSLVNRRAAVESGIMSRDGSFFNTVG
tara:strand:+ start:1798 stop:3333 length:1536 start_codon:yes stop_codon:yes gene_type:complete